MIEGAISLKVKLCGNANTLNERGGGEIPKVYESETSTTLEKMFCKQFTELSAQFINCFSIVRTILNRIA